MSFSAEAVEAARLKAFSLLQVLMQGLLEEAFNMNLYTKAVRANLPYLMHPTLVVSATGLLFYLQILIHAQTHLSEPLWIHSLAC